MTPPVTSGNEIPSTGRFAPHAKEPPTHTGKKPFPWGWTLGGVGILAAIGTAIYFMTRGAKKRKNPCSCSNPLVVEAMGYESEERDNPYGGSIAYPSIDGGVLDHAALVSPLLKNPKKRRRKARR